MSDQLWFHAKRYGFGWTPATWQGRIVTAAYTAAVVAWVVFLLAGSEVTIGRHVGVQSWAAVLLVFALTAGLIAICWLKGERPRWRWGR